MNLLKSNQYNILIPVEEREEFLLFNTLTGGIEILNFEEGSLVSELMLLNNFDKSDVPTFTKLMDYLYEREYIVDDSRNFIDVFEQHTSKNQFKNAGTIHLTIGTTITCNMGCAYCFEFVKPNHTLKDENVKKQIISYVRQIIKYKDNGNIHTLSVTWYGGEPLINVSAIEDLSVGLTSLADECGLIYAANIITNGIYLSPENVQKLIKHKVSVIQVTIDGARDIHDKKRPLKTRNGENYYKILQNLAQLSEGIKVTVRINIDKEVAASVNDMLDDFESYGIWPEKQKQFHFDPAWLRSYEQISLEHAEEEKRMHVDEFFEFKQAFRLELLKRFNSWAVRKGINKARLKWDLPTYQSTCATWASPISLVVDPNGYIHKCWETIHDDRQAPSSVFQDYNPEKFEFYSSFNRYTQNSVCRNCKYLPVCDKISCSFEAIKNKVPQCTEWKYKTESYIKEQYLRMVADPETIALPEAADAVNTGHSNK